MQVRTHKLTYDQIVSIIDVVGIDHYAGNLTAHNDSRAHYPNGDGYAGRITVKSSSERGARRSWSGRRMPAACWHAFRDVFSAILDRDPDAVIVTALARYAGREGFEANYPATGERNIGSMMAPAYMPDLCDCEEW